MPPLPWTQPPGATANHDEVVVMASLLRIDSIRRVPAFLRAAMAIRQQVLRAEGALGVSLNTALPRTFFTLSAWRDRDALAAFVRSEPHISSMRRYRPAMADARFVFWSTTADKLPPSWTDAQHRLHQTDLNPTPEQPKNERAGSRADDQPRHPPAPGRAPTTGR